MRQLVSVPPSEYVHQLHQCTQLLDQQSSADGVFLSGNAVLICQFTEHGWRYEVWEEIY